MENTRKKIKYVFLHFDGVILENILAPITYSVVKKLGGDYSAEIENNVFARSQSHAASFIIKNLNLALKEEDIINLYYEERKAYEDTHSIKINQGAELFLTMLENLGYQIVTYGGAPKDYFLKHGQTLSKFFSHDKYIQTRDFRPGIKEIVFQMYHLNPWEALFIDEEYIIAQAAKENKIPFIGMTTGYTYSFQKFEMQKLGVRYLVDSLQDIDQSYLNRVEQDASDGSLWTKTQIGNETITNE